MKQLESVFIKNVVLYLQTSSDICSFVLINKKYCESIQSMYCASYNLCRNTPLPKIQQYFPNIQTIYIEAITSESAKIGPSFKPYIDLNISKRVLKNDFNHNLVKNLDNISDYAKNIRKLKIEGYMLFIIAVNNNEFVELKNLVIHSLDDCSLLEKVLCIPSLRDVTIYFSQTVVHKLADFDFQKYNKISFTFVFQNKSQLLKKKQIDGAKRLAKKYPLYMQMLTKETVNMKFIPDIQMAYPSFEKRLTVSISSDMSGKENFIEEVMKKCMCSRLDISPLSNSKEIDDQRYRKIATFDFLKSEIINEVVLKQINCKSVVLPQKCRAFEIIDCEGNVCAEQCYPEEVYIDQFERETITINEDKLKGVCINAYIRNYNFVCKGQKGIILIDFKKVDFFDIRNENINIGLMYGDTLISKIRVDGIIINLKKLEIINCVSDVMLEGITLEEVTFSNTRKETAFSATLSDVKKVNVCGGLLKILQIGKCDEIKVSTGAVIELLKKTKQNTNLITEGKVVKVEIMED
ncbi:hypothetical protein EIN_090260 [Entamoeba invadens IP1]|uniref:Uncharacterized protein n=1 Tax=Entamoeba invadens IP1 TaxID=370355 RepID=A0A0A1TXV8_ENTIV|nr:hypothetical protein EIN_090260 [Entamoeba invadens IP1]ELP84393.1 hypothetical protein EIN_090260 [Entamoeba invadens IP1]|eukprot:XP_004183739.1 hypothetical protein EIN_090260 [Entamoeba invadens IP1]